MLKYLFLFIVLVLSSGAFTSLHWSLQEAAGMGSSGESSLNTILWLLASVATTLFGLFVLPRVLSLFSKNIALVFLTMLAVLSTVWSIAPIASLYAGVALTGCLFTAAIIRIHYNDVEIYSLLNRVALFLAVSSLLVVLLLPDAGIMGGMHEDRWRGVFAHKNALARCMALGLIISLISLFYARKPKVKLALIVFSAIYLVVLIATGSASNLVVVTLAVAAWLLIAALRSLIASTSYSLLPMLLLIGAAGIFIASDYAWLLELLGRDITLTGRTLIWTASVAAIEDAPVLGYGHSVFWRDDVGLAYSYLGLLLNWDAPHAHNGVLELGLNLGLIGVVVFLFSLVLLLAKAWVQAYHEKTLVSDLNFTILVAFIITNISECTLLRPGIHWIVYLLVAFSISQIHHQGRASKAPSK